MASTKSQKLSGLVRVHWLLVRIIAVRQVFALVDLQADATNMLQLTNVHTIRLVTRDTLQMWLGESSSKTKEEIVCEAKPGFYHPRVPGSPLNGPTILLVIQPP